MPGASHYVEYAPKARPIGPKSARAKKVTGGAVRVGQEGWRSRFERQMRLEDAGLGRHRTVVSEDWNCPFLPHGGIVTAIVASAMAAELNAPEQRLRLLNGAQDSDV